MTFSEQLIRHAIRLLGNPPIQPEVLLDVELRRSTSAAYYALFHRLSEAAVEQIAPYAASRIANKVHRWVSHGDAKKICQEFARPQLRPPLQDLLSNTASTDMQLLAANFVALQEARHKADYDLEFSLTWEEAREFVELAVNGIGAWTRVERTSEGNIFILSLFLWKNWQVERP